MLQWRKFQFFEKELIKDPESADPQRPIPHKIISQFSPNCVTSGRGLLILGNLKGEISLVERDMTVTTFQAIVGDVELVSLARERNLLAVVGLDTEQGSHVLKVFNMDKLDSNKCPLEISSATVKLDVRNNARVMAVTPDMSDVAVGFITGQVLLVHYDRQLRYAQTRTICQHDPPTSGTDDVGITGLEFKRDESLYVVTSQGLYEYPIQLTSQNQFRLFGGALTAPPMPEETVLDYIGAGLHCTSVTEDGEVIVGTGPAVFFWKDEEKRQCLAFDGKKKFLHWFRGNLIVVTEIPSPAGDSRTVNDLTIYDTKNKLIAFQDNRFSDISLVAFEWGSAFVFTSDGKDCKVYELVEKDIQSKLDSLFKKNLYSVAITLAQNNQLDAASIAFIIVRFAEHLYSKGDYDGSIQQFIKTIGQLEPSYVIGKFLDAQRIYNLTSYLQALHEKGVANSDHTTLLLNCYTKLKNAEKIEQFLSKDQGGNFDVETAIKVCRSGGYFDHALRLSQQYHEHDWYLKIQLEDLHHYDVALQYISNLRHDESEKYLKKYGKILMSHIPEETTKQLVMMCTTDPVQPDAANSSSAAATGAAAAAAPAAAAEHSSEALPAVEPLPSDIAGGSGSEKDLPPVVQLDLGSLEPISTTSQFASAAMEKAAEYRDKAANFFSNMLPLGKKTETVEKEQSEEEVAPAAESAAASAAKSAAPAMESRDSLFLDDFSLEPTHFERSKPEDFIHIYVGLPRWLRTFLEEVISKTENVSSVNYDTLLELYIRGEEDETHKETKEEKEERLEKARQLLQESRGVRYDRHHALVLCQRYGFDAGVLILLEKLEMYYEIIQTHMERHEYARVLQDCFKFGKQDPNLWIQALTYFASLDDDGTGVKYEKEIADVLDNIDKQGLMSPLLVLQILSQKPSMPLNVVKTYITNCLQAESKTLEQSQREIDEYRAVTTKLRNEIQELTTQPKVFQISKCSYCGLPLNPPAVHFLCMHSFHQHCLSENDRECPICAPNNKQTLDAKRNLEEKAMVHSQFMKQLDGAKDGFSVIAEYCGHCIFGCLNNDPSETPQGGIPSSSTSALPSAVPDDNTRM